MIDRRLEAMTAILEDLRTQRADASNGLEPRYDTAESIAIPSSNPCWPYYSKPATGSIIEGQSSLSAHSVFVKDFIDNFVQSDLPGQPDQQIRRTLDALSDIANDSNQCDTVGEQLVTQGELQSHARRQRRELPPIEKAAPLIRLAKSKIFPNARNNSMHN